MSDTCTKALMDAGKECYANGYASATKVYEPALELIIAERDALQTTIEQQQAVIEAADNVIHYADGMVSVIRDLAQCPGKAEALSSRIAEYNKLGAGDNTDEGI